MNTHAQLKFMIGGQFLPDSRSDLDFLWSKTFFFSVSVEKYVILKPHTLP